MNNPLISIIVPVYNVEKYIRVCLDSIIAQSFKDWECILVDDGSNDGSGVICDEYLHKDSRIQVIHKTNGGVSSSRNMACSIAKGDYLYFADADDMLLPDCLSVLYKHMNENIDLVTASYNKYIDGIEVPEKIFKDSCIFTIREYLETISTLPNAHFCERYCVTKLFRKSIIDDNRLRFNEKFAYREDVLFLYSYVIACHNNIAGINIPVYNYYRRSSGAASTHTQSITAHSSDIFFAIEKCYLLVRNSGLSPIVEELLIKEMVYAYYHFRKLLDNSNKKEYQHIVVEMDKKLYVYMDRKKYIKMKIKDILRPIYHFLRLKKLMLIFYGCNR